MPRKFARACIVLATAALASFAAYAAPGDLDPAFGTAGATDFTIGPSVDHVAKVVRDLNGKAIAVGRVSIGYGVNEANKPESIALARFNADGTLDTTFGNGGRVVHSPSTSARGIDAVVQNDGSIVVLGACGTAASFSTPARACMFRFSPDGAVDPSFAFNVNTFSQGIASIALQPDGKIVAGVGDNRGLGVARLNANGTLDPSFGVGGIAMEGGSSLRLSRTVAVMPDGSLIVTGETFFSAPELIARRFTSTGTLDTTYQPVVSGSGTFYASAAQPDGKLLIGGCVPTTSPSRATVLRLLTNGALDPSFNSTGVAQPATWDDMCVQSMIVRPNGAIALGASDYREPFGSTNTPAGPALFRAAQLTASGAIDAAFGIGGQVAISAGGTFDVAWSALLDASGRMILAGDRDRRDFALMRLDLVGAPDLTYGTAGVASTEFGVGRAGQVVEMRVASAKTVVLAYLPEQDVRVPGIGEVGLARFSANGQLDTAFGAGGTVVTSLSTLLPPGATTARPRALAVQPDEKILVGGLGGQGPDMGPTIMRLNADGTLDATFGVGGRKTVFTGRDIYSGIQRIELLASGKILVAGRVQMPPVLGGGDYTYDPFVARLLPDGSLDPTFGTNGITTLLPAPGFWNYDGRTGLAFQADGSIIVSGVNNDRPAAVRLSADGVLDTSFGTSGRFAPAGSGVAYSVAIQADGRIAIAGTWRFGTIGTCGSHTLLDKIVFARSNASGTVDASVVGGGLLQGDLRLQHAGLWSARLAADDRTIAAGFRRNGCYDGGVALNRPSRGRATVMRFTSAGALDTSFGPAGMVELGDNFASDNHTRDVAPLADGSILAATENSRAGIPFTLYKLQGGGASAPAPLPQDIDADGTADASDSDPFVAATTYQTLSAGLTPNSQGAIVSIPGSLNCVSLSCFASYPTGSTITLRAIPAFGWVFAGWAGACSGTGVCQLTMNGPQSVTASFLTLLFTVPTPVAVPDRIDFGGASRMTTARSTLTITNMGPASLAITGISSDNSQFTQTNDCSSLGAGASCTVQVAFTPTITASTSGVITVFTSNGTLSIPVTGIGENSLITHFYRAILNRAPDSQGKIYWDSEVQRLVNLKADVNEVWYVMAGYFFNSAEYASYNKTNAQFVTDLYNTFFNRAPDPSGTAYWTGELAAGLPREVVLFSFMFSAEFRSFTTATFGNTAARPEVNVVTDLFRGLLNRLPDTQAFNYWVGQLRVAQCSGDAAVRQKVEQMSATFMFGPEYTNRSRNNTQFVTDLYYSFLRRGGDRAGVAFWVDQLNSGQRDRNGERLEFLGSPEFSARVNAVVAAGCVEGASKPN